MATMQERAELHKTIWKIANDLRGSVDGWEFKAYVLWTMDINSNVFEQSIFGTKRQAITKHLQIIYECAELKRDTTSSILELVQKKSPELSKEK